MSGDDAVERHLEVPRTARYWTLGPGDAQDAWIVLHGYAQLARRFLRRFESLASRGHLIVAPEALSRFYIGSGTGPHPQDALVGASWMTREDRDAEMSDYVTYLDRLAAAAVPTSARVTVLGFSQGVATAWRWVAGGGAPGLTRLVAWAGTLPPELDLARAAAAIGDAEVVLVGGERDRTVGPERIADAAERLTGASVVHRVVLHPRGHDIHEETLLEVARTLPRT